MADASTRLVAGQTKATGADPHRGAGSVVGRDALRIPVGRVTLEADLALPAEAAGLVLFAHGSGSSRFSPRNRQVARVLNEAGFATVLADLLTPEEERVDERTRHLRFDIALLGERLVGAADWLRGFESTAALALGLFGASTGAGAALVAAALRPDRAGRDPPVRGTGNARHRRGARARLVPAPPSLERPHRCGVTQRESVIRRTSPMRPDIAPGKTFPDYVLPDHTKTERRLSALQTRDDPMLLVLIRGFFCPKDREQLKALTAFHSQLVVGTCQLVVITADDWHTTNNLRQQLGAHYPFLYDEKKVVRDDLDICEYTDTTHEPMVPHTFLLGPELRIHRIWNGYYYWGRPSTAELHEELRELTRSIRPDWDLSDPQLKQRWKNGDKKAFYPYGSKSMEQVLKEMAGAVDQYAGAADAGHRAPENPSG